MEWKPYPTSHYIRAKQRRYYSASDEVQHMMWGPYPAAYFIRARRHRFNKPKDQGMMGGSFPSRNIQPAAASKNTVGKVQNHFATTTAHLELLIRWRNGLAVINPPYLNK